MTSRRKEKGIKFEKEVQELLQKHGWTVIRKGKGVDLIALKNGIVLIIECKNWNAEICGQTLRNIVGKLKREVRKIVKLYSHLITGNVVPILISNGRIRDTYRTDPVLVFEFGEFVRFIQKRGE